MQSESPFPGSTDVVAVESEEHGGLLAAAVRDGRVELAGAVLLRGTARRAFEERGPRAEPGELARDLLRGGAPSRAEARADAHRFLAELESRGLRGGAAPGAPAGHGEPDPGAVELSAADFERLAREVLRRGLRLRYRVQGRSMRPQIPSGSVVEVAGRPFDEVRRGEVAVYAAGTDRLVAHRVVGRRGDRLLARGDSSTRLDEVGEASYLGIACARIGPTGAARPLTSGPRRLLGLASSAAYGVAARIAVQPVRRSFGRRSLTRSILGGALRLASGAILRTERAARRLRRPLDVGRAALHHSREQQRAHRAPLAALVELEHAQPGRQRYVLAHERLDRALQQRRVRLVASHDRVAQDRGGR